MSQPQPTFERGELLIELRPTGLPYLLARETPDGIYLRMLDVPGAAMNLTPELADALEAFLRGARAARADTPEARKSEDELHRSYTESALKAKRKR